MSGQDHGFFNQVWLEQGLSQSSINDMLQDDKGFLWFATQDGLNRYDGRNMDHFNFKPFDKRSISGDYIYSISRIGPALYILNDKAVDRMDLDSLKTTPLKNTGDINDRFFKCWSVNEDLYFLGRNGLARVKQTSANTFTPEYLKFDKEVRAGITSVCGDEKQNIYVSTTNGIYSCTPGENTMRLLYRNETVNKNAISSENFFTTIACRNGRIYFTAPGKLYSLDLRSAKKQVLKYDDNHIPNSLLLDRKNNIWISAPSKGVYLIRQKQNDSLLLDKHFQRSNYNRFTLQTNDITCLYQNPQSADDHVWIGTKDAGVFNYSYHKNSFSVPTSFVHLPDLNFFSVVKDKDGIIWAGSNSGIMKLDRKTKEVVFIDLSAQLKLLDRPVEAIDIDKNNNVWVAYGNKLFVINRNNNSLEEKLSQVFPQRHAQISRLTSLNDSVLIVCGSQGIVTYNIFNRNTSTTFSIDVNGKPTSLENASAFLYDSQGNWWVGCFNGLFCIKRNAPNLLLEHNNSDSTSLLSNRIMDIKESRSGEILVATTKGLSIIEKNGNLIKNYFSAKGLPNNFIYGLLEDHLGRFWMSTNLGLSVFDPNTDKFKSYLASDGICINEFNSGGFFKSSDGELLFGGLGGLVSVYPEQQEISTNVANIVLRKIKILDYFHPISLDRTTRLSYSQNDIDLQFSVPDYSGEQNINLYYRFRNRDSNLVKINPSKLLSLSFINLAPGEFDLEVFAINKEGARSAPFNMRFIVEPPFWSTWWFYFILVAITGLISYVVYRARLHRKIEHLQEIEQIRKEENEKVRKAAALDLHDEFGNGLTRISMLIEMIKIHIRKDDTEALKLLDLISQNSNRLYHGTKDFIWSINPGNDNLYEVIIRIKDYADELFYGGNMVFEIEGLTESMKEHKQTPTAGRNIAMIFKESLSNVSKHAKANKVKLRVFESGGEINMELTDNGVGFEKKDHRNSFGISNIKQRASRLNAAVEIESEPGKGTRLILKIKNNSANDKQDT